MFDIFKSFIEANPSKILGTQKETTDRFGNPDIKIVGTIQELEKIDVSEVNAPAKNNETENIFEEGGGNLDKRLANIEKSLTATEAQYKAAQTVQKKHKPSPKKFKYILDGDNSQDLYTGEEAFEILNKQQFTDDFLSVWYWYNSTNNIPINNYFKKFEKAPSNDWFDLNKKNGNLCYDPTTSSYIPSVLYYSGNIYDKIIAIDNAVFPEGDETLKANQQKRLRSILPKELKLTGKKDERLVIDPLSKFAEETLIDYLGAEQTIQEAFKSYLSNLDRESIKYSLSAYKVVSIHLNRDRFPNNTPAYTKAEQKRLAALEVEHQMSIFLAEELDSEAQRKIEVSWNRENNSLVDVNYNQIPLYFEFSKYFKESILEIRPAQREGIAFNSTNGTGVIAYDVGVGKTLTAILNIANAIQMGVCKKPLFVVPKQTYDKWISEIRGVYDDDGNLIGSGLLPQYPIYDLFNLNTSIASAVIDENGQLKNIPEECILITTYEGMGNIGFGDEESNSFITELKEILNQGFGDESERQKALDNEKLNKKIGIGLEGTKINIEDIGADYLTIDEAHNMNKIFSSVKGEASGGKRESSPYQIQGSESARGIKSFFISNYIQRNSNGNGNICLLTATPFTNSPLEVFNILSLTNIKRLASIGIKNVTSFFDNYVNQTYEKVIKQNGEIVEQAVIKGWSNKVALQKILFSYMNYKSGEDANIKRPTLWTLPKLSEQINGVRVPLAYEDQIPTFLEPTAEQKSVQKEIGQWLVDQLKDTEAQKKAPHLVADIKAKKNCISPYVYYGTNPESISPKDFIESSPKLKYTMECIKSVIEWHKKNDSPISGQIIYINGGIDYLGLVKDYLDDELGFKKSVVKLGRNKSLDEVEVLVGGGSNTPPRLKRNDDEKEEIKNLFLNGKIKVIIGSSTIREGIDLQKKSSVLYNLWVDWNPTDYKQLAGRIWRYGNIFANVRIVTPLLIGSSDAFTYQKLEEKTARINDIFDRNDRTNILEVSEEDREEVKWALIDDLTEVAKAKIKDKIAELTRDKKIVTDRIEFLQTIDYNLRDVDNLNKSISTAIEDYWPYISEKYPDITDQSERLFKLNRNKVSIAENYSGHNTWVVRSKINSAVNNYKSLLKLTEKLETIDLELQREYNVGIQDNLEEVISSLTEKVNDILTQIAYESSEDRLFELTQELEEERKKFNSGVLPFTETVKRFTDLNYLLGILKGVDQKPKQTVSAYAKTFPDAVSDKDAIEVSPASETQQLSEAIEVLNTLLEFADASEKDEIIEAIEILKILEV